MFVYIIRSDSSNKFYIGITKNINRRRASHKYLSKYKDSKLYTWMRKYIDWELISAYECKTKEEACQDEVFWIEFGRVNNWQLLNLAVGGEGGYVISEDKKPAWIEKLKEKRAGRKPALGMKHTEENKKLFSIVSNKYWESVKTYNPSEVLIYNFKQANEIFGISRTHYYRLKRESLANDSELL